MGPEELKPMIEIATIQTVPPKSIDRLKSWNYNNALEMNRGSNKECNSLLVHSHHIRNPSDLTQFPIPWRG